MVCSAPTDEGETAGATTMIGQKRGREAPCGGKRVAAGAVKRAGLRGDTGRGRQRRSGSEPIGGDLGIVEDAALHLGWQYLG